MVASLSDESALSIRPTIPRSAPANDADAKPLSGPTDDAADETVPDVGAVVPAAVVAVVVDVADVDDCLEVCLDAFLDD